MPQKIRRAGCSHPAAPVHAEGTSTPRRAGCPHPAAPLNAAFLLFAFGDLLLPTAAKVGKNAAGGRGFRTPLPPNPHPKRPMGAAAPFGIPQGWFPHGGENPKRGAAAPIGHRRGFLRGGGVTLLPLNGSFAHFSSYWEKWVAAGEIKVAPAGAKHPCRYPPN